MLANAAPKHTPMSQVADKIGWKVSYVRAVAPETRGCLVMQLERGRFQVSMQRCCSSNVGSMQLCSPSPHRVMNSLADMV